MSSVAGLYGIFAAPYLRHATCEVLRLLDSGFLQLWHERNWIRRISLEVHEQPVRSGLSV